MVLNERRYYYYVDLQGRLFIEDVIPKNITSCLKSEKVRMLMYVCVYACMYVGIYVYIYVCMFVGMYICMVMYLYIHTYIHIYIYIIYIYIVSQFFLS